MVEESITPVDRNHRFSYQWFMNITLQQGMTIS